ncbi:MAG: hypothetical protein QF903_11785 [Planctomycetota bacterium]|nr:hypothetical protein [Planctomycetota bacterium]MDP6763705.1 hypothetical protein [Planctomycetota bacterium]MDP6990141.1 hypothetical protein [Planctomycetota bacterium]
MSAARGRIGAAVLACLLAACAGDMRWPYIPTQRTAGPMESVGADLSPGTRGLLLPGPEEVLVVRHADPVQLRPAGELSAFPLRFYEKSRRVTAGSWIHSAPGGRAEVLWPDGGSLVLFGRTTGIVASPSRGEPLFVFLELERADITLTSEEQIELPGGALLVASSGPFVIELRRDDVLRVSNQSKVAGELAFRDRVFGIDPSQGIDVPLLSIGGEPVEPNPGTALGGGSGFTVEVQGDVEAERDEHGWRLTAGGSEHEVGALGVRLRLGRGETALVRGLGAVSGESPAEVDSDPGTDAALDADAAPEVEALPEAEDTGGIEAESGPEPGPESEGEGSDVNDEDDPVADGEPEGEDSGGGR